MIFSYRTDVFCIFIRQLFSGGSMVAVLGVGQTFGGSP
jgi:hypothetical protein